MRHGKAETASSQGDHARALSPRGRAEAAEAGRRLAALTRPDLALVSDSRRTRETYENAATAFDPAVPHRLAGALYAADADALLAEVRATPPEVGRLLVIGHNPGTGDLARRLAGTGDPTGLRALADGFPTSCFAILDFDASTWSEIGGNGRLAFLFPADERRRA